MSGIPWKAWALLAMVTGCQGQAAILRAAGLGGGSSVYPTFQVDPDATQNVDEVIVTLKDSSRLFDPSALAGEGVMELRGAADGSMVLRFQSPEVMRAVLDRLKHDPDVAAAEPNYKVFALSTPNDPMLDQLWGHQKIQAESAWDTVTGSKSVVVADVDTGIDYNHPDLSGVSITKGPDLVNNDTDPMDDNGHGTHVAGTIAAAANNHVGIAGVAYGIKILAIKVLAADGSGNLDAIANGIRQAQKMGAKVINLSLGGPNGSSTLQRAIDDVTAAGTLVVAAAGNDGSAAPSFPAYYDNALAVGATDKDDTRASFSNFGIWVDIAAPGVNILSTTGGGYKSWSGTSMATPHVVAAAALLLSKDPSLSPAKLRDLLQNNGDTANGFGTSLQRVNVMKALSAIGSSAPPPDSSQPFLPPPIPPLNPVSMVQFKVRMPEPGTLQMDWLTDIPGDSQVAYGPSPSLGQTTSVDTTTTMRHVVQLSGFQPNGIIYMQGISTTATGKAVSPLIRVILDSWLPYQPPAGKSSVSDHAAATVMNLFSPSTINGG